jgi:hypothetical protein
MAVHTSIQPRQKWWNIAYAGICLVLALWGAYDYWVTIPVKEAAVAAYDAAAKQVEDFEAKAQASQAAPGGASPLSAEEVAAYTQAKAVVDKGRPTPPAAYDRPVQLWMYMVGCGVMGVPWFLWQWIATARRRYSLEDDGTLVAPEGRFGRADIADIDMDKWMSKSLATVVLTDGRKLVLDDYKHRDMHLIVGAIASERYPEKWSPEARDLDRVRAEAEAADASKAAAGPESGGGAAG